MDSDAHIKRKKNPRENASWLSLISYFFTFNILRKGYRAGIQKEDIYEIVKDFRSENVGNQLEKEWEMREKKKKIMFLYSLFRIFWKQIGLLGLTLALVESTAIIIKPILIGKITAYFTPGQTEITFNKALCYTLGLSISVLIYDCYMNVYFLLLSELYLKIRAACCTLIYRKCLKLNAVSLDKCANGYAVTLMTKDMLCFEPFLDGALVLINMPIQAGFLIYILYNSVGVAGLLGLAVLLVVFPLQGILSSDVERKYLALVPTLPPVTLRNGPGSTEPREPWTLRHLF